MIPGCDIVHKFTISLLIQVSIVVLAATGIVIVDL